jgi:hypothetical protein
VPPGVRDELGLAKYRRCPEDGEGPTGGAFAVANCIAGLAYGSAAGIDAAGARGSHRKDDEHVGVTGFHGLVTRTVEQ